MADFPLRNASSEEIENFVKIQQQAAAAKTAVFDVASTASKFLFFGFDGTGDDKANPDYGPQTNVANLVKSVRDGIQVGSDFGSGNARQLKASNHPEARITAGFFAFLPGISWQGLVAPSKIFPWYWNWYCQ